VTKQLIREFLDAGMANADRSILEVATPLFESADMQGGVATFLEVGPFELLERVHFDGR
jgi:hypothetical protein